MRRGRRKVNMHVWRLEEPTKVKRRRCQKGEEGKVSLSQCVLVVAWTLVKGVWCWELYAQREKKKETTPGLNETT